MIRFFLLTSLALFLSITLIVFLTSTPLGTISSNNHIIPQGSPLGESHPYTITAYFHDPTYYKIFHMQHTGIDLIPTGYPIPSNKPVFLYATINGFAYRHTETCSGNAVIIVNKDYIVYLGHIQSFLIHDNTPVTYGEKVAIMGESGIRGQCVTGPHVHYQIYKWVNNIFVIVNPLPYL